MDKKLPQDQVQASLAPLLLLRQEPKLKRPAKEADAPSKELSTERGDPVVEKETPDPDPAVNNELPPPVDENTVHAAVRDPVVSEVDAPLKDKVNTKP